jgi:hypothetical protein
MSDRTGRILYCYCKYARVIPPEVKSEVLMRLAASDLGFDAVPDLCEMSARQDPRLSEMASGDRILACYPRAVRGLFQAAGFPLPDGVEILNMRATPAEDLVKSILPAGALS